MRLHLPVPCAAPRRPIGLPWRAHDSDEEHLHELSIDARGAIAEIIWKIDNVELTTVGIDIGSSTSHLMFARVRLQRRTQQLSSEFVVIGREVLWRSPILFTPFRDDETIDAAALRAFVDDAYVQAGLGREDVDTGAVILTGEAIRKRNAEAIASLFAADSGKFVCASAGHHLECALAAHGSGAVALSRQRQIDVLNVDVGGGTTKLARIVGGEIVDTAAMAVGGRLVAFAADNTLVRVDDAARAAAEACDVPLERGQRLDPQALDRVVDALADVVIAAIAGETATALGDALRLTPRLEPRAAPAAVTFSGGVAEYIYGREHKAYGDIAAPLAARIVAAIECRRIGAARYDPGEGIRATVIGASQFSVQVSGKTIHLGRGIALPLHDVPVVAPELALNDTPEAAAVARAVGAACRRADRDPAGALAIAVRWTGDPHYERLRALAEGIAAVTSGGARDAPLILIVDGDVARNLGAILEHELRLPRALLVVDGITLREFDYVDIGAVIEPAHVVPVVIKSLLFAAGQQYLRRRGTPLPPSHLAAARREMS